MQTSLVISKINFQHLVLPDLGGVSLLKIEVECSDDRVRIVDGQGTYISHGLDLGCSDTQSIPGLLGVKEEETYSSLTWASVI